MKTFTVTITDMTAWTATVRAKDTIHAEHLAWRLFHETSDRGEVFATHDDTTIKAEEVQS